MYDYIRGDVLFIMLYTVVTTMSLVASCYLLFRQGNAFAADITPPCAYVAGQQRSLPA